MMQGTTNIKIILLHFSHDRPNRCFPSFSSTTFQNFPDVSDLLRETSKFQHLSCKNMKIKGTEMQFLPFYINVAILPFLLVQQHRLRSILINVQQDATICSLYFILLQYHSTCFWCRPHPSSGVHKTVVTATGTSVMFVQLPHSSVARFGHAGVR